MNDRTDEILVHLDYLRKGQDEANGHLRALNGRVGRTETEIAILKDRADGMKTEARKSGGAFGAIGAFLGGVGIIVYQHFAGGK